MKWMLFAIYCYYALLLIIFLIGCVRYKKLTRPFRIITFFILTTLITEIIRWRTGVVYRNSNPTTHLWVLIEYSTISFIYYLLLNDSLQKRIILISIFIFPLIIAGNILLFEPLLQYPSNVALVSESAYLIFSLLYFKQMLFNPVSQSIFKQSLFWFNTSTLLYCTTLFLNFGLTNYIIKHNLSYSLVGKIIFIMNFVYYALIAFAFIIDDNQILVKIAAKDKKDVKEF
jgi:hypothetical protein